jgi:fibronectin-binding autotransporter adhesin
MKLRELVPAVAVVATGMTTAALALPLMTAEAAVPVHRAAAHAAPHGARLSTSELSQVRIRQQQMLTTGRTAPTLSRTGSTTFTVNTVQDSDLANPAGTHCVDAATGKCSLRAAVNAANNLAKPVKIVLGSHTYTLSSGTELTVTNPAGTSIVGAGAGSTSVKGSGSRVFMVTQSGALGAADPLLFLTSLKVTGGTSPDYGGGIYLDYSSFAPTLVLDGVVISGNSATSYGGGIYNDDYATIYANNSRISNNVSQYGAGLYTYWTNTNFTNVDITGNHTPAGVSGGGAGWYNEYGVNRMKGGSISGNTAGDATDNGYGGAMYDEYGNTAFTKVHLDDNIANDAGYGGAIEAYYDLLQLTGGTMSHNRANGQYAEGGALYIEDGAQVDLQGVAMVGNKVTATDSDGYGGGAIYMYGYEYGNQLNITGSTISGSNAGAVYAYATYGQADITITKSTLNGNHNSSANGYSGYGCGGAVCAYTYDYGGVNLSMTANKLVGNTSTSSAANGSGAVSLYSYYYGSTTASFKGNLFEKNTAGAYGLGGAIGAYDVADSAPISIHSQSNTFVANKAGASGSAGLGGAVGLYYYSAFTDKGSTFSNNRAIGDGAYGGAFYSESYQSSRFTGSKFTGNAAGPATGGSGYGGAIYTEDEAGTTFNKVTVSGNTAASYGGGIYADTSAYSVSVEQSTISGNTAGNSTSDGTGGGIYSGESVLSLENSTIADNRARGNGYGGGVYANDGSTFGLRYTTVSGNLAKHGGGVYSDEPGGTLLSSIVSDNHKTAGGTESDCTFAIVDATFHSLGGNVIGQGSCVTATRSGDKVTKNPGLKSLANNGGPTKTMALTAKSPAIGRAMFQIPSTDQRGHGRPSKHADAGAFELPKV